MADMHPSAHRFRPLDCYGADIGVTATPEQLVSLAAMPMTPVTGRRLMSDGTTARVTVYTTTTPGLVLQQVADITRTTVTTDGGHPRVAYATAWSVAHHSLAIAGVALEASTYPGALQTAREMGRAGLDWTATHQELYEAMPHATGLQEALRRARHDHGGDFIDLVHEIFALDRPCWGDGLSAGAYDRIDEALTWGWTPQALADRITHRLRCGGSPQARHRAFQARLSRLHRPADVFPRLPWCLDCDPGTRLVADDRGWLTACRTCHSDRMGDLR